MNKSALSFEIQKTCAGTAPYPFSVFTKIPYKM